MGPGLGRGKRYAGRVTVGDFDMRLNLLIQQKEKKVLFLILPPHFSLSG